MALQLFQQGYGNVLPSPHFSLTQALLVSTFFLAANFPNVIRNPPIAKSVNTAYDFIVVGAGSAGAVVANRLSENPDYSVLLLEAGGEASEISDIPHFAGLLQIAETDWNYTSEPSDEFCLGMENKACAYARGRVLGGSSTLNHMFYVRGTKEDYDDWSALGNYGWSFDEVLPFFKKSEDNRNYYFAKNKKFHSTGGLQTVSDQRWVAPVTKLFVKAGKELGYFNQDVNAENQTAFVFPQMTMRDGFRCSTNKAFLVPAGDRKNLDILTHAHATKVLIDGKTKRAYGVRYFWKGAYHDVIARKEVILSAGVFNTPQLLMLSGIGPKEHLNPELGITVFQDLRVGFNLQDHSGYFMPFLTDKPVTFIPERYNNDLTNMSYDIYQNGPLSSILLEGSALVNSKYQDPSNPRPDIQLYLLAISPSNDEGLTRHIYHFSDELYETIYRPIEHKDSFLIYVSNLRPKSIGRVLLRSTDPFDKPVLKLNYFSSPEDVKVLVDGGRISLDLMETKAFREVNGRYHYVPLPTCPDVIPLSDEYFECFMRYNTQPFLHGSGTAKMGPVEDPDAVVDPELRVHGITGLRVADTSIMPNIVSGNTNSPAIMIGEKASDLIKRTWEEKGTNGDRGGYY